MEVLLLKRIGVTPVESSCRNVTIFFAYNKNVIYICIGLFKTIVVNYWVEGLLCAALFFLSHIHIIFGTNKFFVKL